MNTDLTKIFVVDIDEQWTKGEKDTVMGYKKNYFVGLTNYPFIWYDKITLG